MKNSVESETPEALRSRVMRSVKSSNTKPEIQVRSFLHRRGFRFRLNYKHLPGRPDIVLLKYKTAIFINGCFWHQHKGCKHARKPKSNLDYWEPKLKRNVRRDAQVRKELEQLGWNVLVIWECKLSDDAALHEVCRVLSDSLKNK